MKDVKISGVVKRAFPERMRPKARVMVVPDKIVAINSVASGKAPKSFDFGDERSYTRIFEEARKGRADLDASFQMRYDEANLYLTVKVADDVFLQSYDGAETWKGDGLQLAVQTLAKDFGDDCDHSDFDVALTKGGPLVYRQYSSTSAQPGVASEIPAKISQDGKTTLYEITIPAKAVGLPVLKPGLVFGFSLLVNDDDGKGRKGYLHWGDGIGMSKDDQRRLFTNMHRFDPAVLRTKEEGQGGPAVGTGLGLLIAKGIVKLNGGTINVFSDGEGKGTTFTIRLPAEKDVDTANRMGNEATTGIKVKSHEARILLISE